MYNVFCVKFSQEWVLKFSRNPCLKLYSKFNKKGDFLANFDLKNAKKSMCFKLQALHQSQMINAKTPMLEIARFYHRTVKFRQILSKFKLEYYKHLIKDCFFPIKMIMVDHDEISKNCFFQIQKLYKIICHSRPISHLQLKAFRNESSLKMKGQNLKVKEIRPSHHDIFHFEMGYLSN